MKKGFLLVWAGVLIALVFSLFSLAASDPVVTEEFTENTQNFFTTYEGKWYYQNIGKSDLEKGTIVATVDSGILKITTKASKTPHIVSKFTPNSQNYAVTAVVKTGPTASAGFLGRWYDKEYFYTLRLRGNGELDLSNSKVGGETLKSLNTGLPLTVNVPDFNPDKWYKVTMEVKNEGSAVVILGYLDDQLLMNVKFTDPKLQITEGSPGLYCSVNNDIAEFENFVVTMLD